MARILRGLPMPLKILRPSKESSVFCQAHLFVICLLSHADSPGAPGGYQPRDFFAADNVNSHLD